MSLSHLDEFILVLLTGLVISVLLAMIGLWACAIPSLLRGEPLLSPIPILPRGPARWGGGTVSAVILLYIAANVVAGLGYGAWSGASPPAPPGDHPAAASESATADETAASSAVDAEDQKAEAKPKHSSFTLMLLNAIGSLLMLILLPTVLRRSAGVPISELGFSWKSWPRQVGVGVAAASLTTPVIYAIQFLAARYWAVNDHDVQKMMAENLSLDVAAFALVSTVFLAPLVEESLFRGVLLGWLTRILRSPSVAPPSPAVAAESIGVEPETRIELDPTAGAIPSEATPAFHVAISDPEPEPIRPNVVSPQAIIATSLLFAAMHASQWPAPVGIFFLSVVIGVVYQRTGSLLTAIVMHGVFNGCGTLLLLQSLLAQMIRNFNGKAPEIAPRLQPAVATLLEWCSSFF